MFAVWHWITLYIWMYLGEYMKIYKFSVVNSVHCIVFLPRPTHRPTQLFLHVKSSTFSCILCKVFFCIQLMITGILFLSIFASIYVYTGRNYNSRYGFFLCFSKVCFYIFHFIGFGNLIFNERPIMMWLNCCFTSFLSVLGFYSMLLNTITWIYNS